MSGPAPTARLRLRDWPLRRRFTLAVGVATVLLAALSAVVAGAFGQLGRAQTEVGVTYFTAVRNSTALLSAYLDQETGVRGYVLTGEDAFLDPYRGGQTDAAQRVATLRRSLADRRDLLALLDRAETAAAEWRAAYAEPVIARVRRAGPASMTAPGADGGRQRFEAVRAAYTRFDDAVLAARSAATGGIETGRRALAASFLALAVLVVGSGATLGVALRRWILLPLDAVGRDVRAVAEGELDQPVESVGPPELRRLGQDVERMRRRIVDDYRSVREANRTVERQRARLERQTEELRRSNAELEQFAYVASHDLQEPLRKVASFTDLLRRRYGGRLDERADTYIDFAVDGAHRMQTIVNDLLAFSRVGRVGAAWGQVALDDVLAVALDDLAETVQETGATVTAGPLPTLPGDAGLLTQVFQNLVGNAIKFRRPGSTPAIRVTARPESDGWRIEVSDDGIGIDPEYAERVFVIFSRLNRREDYPGSGIGLAMAKKIVEYHGGRIGLGDHGDAPGTTIFFSLPSVDRRTVPDPAEVE